MKVSVSQQNLAHGLKYSYKGRSPTDYSPGTLKYSISY